MSDAKLILVINPGSTSTKVAVYENEAERDSRSLPHSAEDLKQYPAINDQLDFRRQAVLDYLKDLNIKVGDLSAISARGGVVIPMAADRLRADSAGAPAGQRRPGERKSPQYLESGAHLADEAFARASLHSTTPHPANLAPVIAYELAKSAGIPAYVYDPVCACGTPEEILTVSGLPELPRPFLTHVLNSRAVCVEQARRDGKDLRDTCYVVSHLGGGITSNLISGGRVHDLVADDEGTFSPERSGGVPCRQLVKLCYSGRFGEKEMQTRLKGQGGLTAYLGTNDLIEIEKRIEAGDEKARLVHEAMALQISKDIASLFPVVEGQVDKIILTGGLAHSRRLTGLIEKRVKFLAPVSVMAGTFEMKALALGALRVLTGRESVHINIFEPEPRNS